MPLRNPETILLASLEAINEEIVIYSLDANNKLIFANKATSKLLGVSPTDLVGRYLHEVLTANKCNQLFTKMTLLFPDAVTVIRGLCEFRTNTDVPLPLRCIQSRVIQDGKPVGFACIAFASTEIDVNRETNA